MNNNGSDLLNVTSPPGRLDPLREDLYPADVAGGGSHREEGFTGRAAIGCDHGYDGQIFYLGFALDLAYVKGLVESCLERIGERMTCVGGGNPPG